MGNSNLVKVRALTRLAVATRETTDAGVFDVYCEDLADVADDVVEEACNRLRRKVQWFPKVAELLAECRIVAREHAEAVARARLAPIQEPRPLTPEELEAGRRRSEDFLARLRQVIDLKKAGLK